MDVEPSGTPRVATEPMQQDAAPARMERMRARSQPDAFNMGKVSLNYRALLPSRFEVDIERRYVLDKLVLGEGGYGKVFVARDSQYENRLVAVKKMTKTGEAKRSEEAFNEEVRIMTQLDHPNICRLFETFEQGRHMFFIMEYCEGGEVFDRIVNDGFVSEAITANIMGQVASALVYAHGKSIAHRDIKPENIVMCTREAGDFRIKVIDWGLSTSFAGNDMRTAVGSLAYAAPEVITSKNRSSYTSACDLWSMAVVAYVMLCGKPPFWGSLQNHLRNAKAEKYPMSAPPWNQISEAGKDFIRQGLKAEPKSRFTAEEALHHEWVCNKEVPPDPACTEEVLDNLHKFRDMALFSQLCITSVARQLDHHHLRDIHQVFRAMDTNGDGTLSFQEIGHGLRKMFGEDSAKCSHLEELCSQLDLDGSGSIDYTEFCAAGLGASAATKADVLWAAFKAFDLDDNGSLSKAEIQKVLDSADVQQVWSSEVCADAAQDIMEKFDTDGDGSIQFEEWRRNMAQCWERRHTCAGATAADAEPTQVQALLAKVTAVGGDATNLGQAYQSLSDANGLSS